MLLLLISIYYYEVVVSKCAIGVPTVYFGVN